MSRVRVAPHEKERFSRIQELLAALGMDKQARADRLAAALLVLTDDQTPNRFANLKKAGLPVSDAARTRHLFDLVAERIGVDSVDREDRDYVMKPLREVGVLEKRYVVPAKEVDKYGTTVVRGKHFGKSPNNSYGLTPEAEELFAVSSEDWPRALAEWVADEENRRRRVFQRETAGTITGDHLDLIHAAVGALQRLKLKDWELVFVDDGDGDRIEPQWLEKLEPLGLVPDLDSLYPDAILVKQRDVWLVDAVVHDGEVDPVRQEQFRTWLSERGFRLAGATTAYLTWKAAAARQGKHTNLAIGSSMWIAEDGGRLFQVEALSD